MNARDYITEQKGRTDWEKWVGPRTVGLAKQKGMDILRQMGYVHHWINNYVGKGEIDF
jgi:hypothetical protein